MYQNAPGSTGVLVRLVQDIFTTAATGYTLFDESDTQSTTSFVAFKEFAAGTVFEVDIMANQAIEVFNASLSVIRFENRYRPDPPEIWNVLQKGDSRRKY